MIKIIWLMGILLIQAPLSLAEDQASAKDRENTPAQALFDVEQKRRLLEEVRTLVPILTELQEVAEPLGMLLKDVRDGGDLSSLLNEIGVTKQHRTLEDRAKDLQQLVAISTALEALASVNPATLELLTTLQGAASTEAMLRNIAGTETATADEDEPIIVFARLPKPNETAEVSFKIGQSKQIHSVQLGESIMLADDKYKLQAVDVHSSSPLRLKIQMLKNDQLKVLYF